MRLVLVSSRKFRDPDQDGNRLPYNATIICWHNMLRYAICCAVMTIPAIWLYIAQWVQNIDIVLYQLYTMKFSVYHSLIRNLFSSLFFSIARNLFNFKGNHVTPDPVRIIMRSHDVRLGIAFCLNHLCSIKIFVHVLLEHSN